MKKVLFFLILSAIIICCDKVHAATYKFYEAEMIPNIYITKKDTSTGTNYYQKARFFRQTGTDEFAYCIEVFEGFYDTADYNQSNPSNLTSTQIDRISKIAHYGYGYPGHSDKSWYAVTQTMIWKYLAGDDKVFFTDTLNGNKVTTYDGMINEINNLITQGEKVPSFNNKEINLVVGQKYELIDTNNVLSKYKSSSLTIKDNKLIIKDLKAGSYNITLTRTDNSYNKPVLFYTSNGSQNLVQTGNINSKNANVRIVVKETNLKLIKLDKDTNSIKPSGEAELKNSIFGIYDEENNLIDKITIGEDSTGSIENLIYGKYILKELTAGVGCKLNEEEIPFEITPNQTEIELKLTNEVIKKKIIINKTYGNKNHQKPECNIEFNIYDTKNKLIKTIKTDNNGKAEIVLPYGNYTIKQLTTTEGYSFNNPIKIKVIDEKDQVLNLKDYQIEVPNTKTNISILEILLAILL